jgi:antitoxin component YwqK of YwqJK toxin-antitoxin module
LENGEACGFGTFFHSNGNKKYEGNFSNSKFNGVGEKFDYDGNSLSKCVWNDDKICSFVLNEAQWQDGSDVIGNLFFG